MKQTFFIPYPISANKMTEGGRGGQRHRSKRYDNFLKEVASEVGRQKVKAVSGLFTIAITLYKRRPNMDLDNVIKPTLDALQECGIIRNDTDCVDVRAVWDANVPAPYAMIILEALS